MTVILGSGVIGCLARLILDGARMVPFRKSRYYSFDRPLADDFIRYADVDGLGDVLGDCGPKLMYKRPFSYQGQLFYNAHPMVVDPYLRKVYGESVPVHAAKALETAFMTFAGTVMQLYAGLQRKFWDEIQGAAEIGKVLSIDLSARRVRCSSGELEYDRLVSTVPLDAFLGLCGRDASGLRARDSCAYRIVSSRVDLEGAGQCLVSDLDIGFYKVVRTGVSEHVFFTFEPVDNPYLHFGSCLGYDLDIVDARRIPGAVPVGSPPDLGWLEELGVLCVGSNAQWDDMMDVTGCVRRILRFAGGRPSEGRM